MNERGKIAKLQARIKLLESGDFYKKSQEELNSQARQIRFLKREVSKLEFWRAGLSISTVLALIAAGDSFVELALGLL